jgi:Tfp pilus assembly protein FimT
MQTATIAILSLVAIPVIRQAIKSYRLKKSVADIAVDAVEAAVDVIDKK